MSLLNKAGRMAPWLEQAWLVRYFERDLAEEESTWFESYLLDKADLLDLLEADVNLRDGCSLPTVQCGLVPASADANLSGEALAGSRRRRFAARPSLFRGFAMAASITLAFGVGFLLRRGPQTAHTDDAVTVNPMRVVVDVSRGGTQENAIDNAASTSDFVLVDAIVPVDATRVLLRAANVPDREVAVSKDGVATLLVRRSELKKLGPLKLLITAGAREYERPLSLDVTKPGDHL